MTTIKAIEARLQLEEEPSEWLETLKNDPRAGVQKAVKRWFKNYEKKGQLRQAWQEKNAFDDSFRPFSNAKVAGVDEAGRGPLAGPVVTAAVILPEDCEALIGLDDSKTLSAQRRADYAALIKEVAIDYAIHIQSVEKIDQMNIYEATRDSMARAVQTLQVPADFVIVDAMEVPLAQPTAAVIKADAKSLAVAAASMLAKTTRDAYMLDLHQQYPSYHFHKNAGYGTKDHLQALKEVGPSPHHRKSFEPIKSMQLNK